MKRQPARFSGPQELDGFITTADEELIRFMQQLEGDIMILGIGGKIGSHIGLLALDAVRRSGVPRKVYGVSRFSDDAVRIRLEDAGITTITCDLLDSRQVSELPKVRNLIYLAGRKFGTEGSQWLTWAMNTLIPSIICQHFTSSRIAAFSTGCVYDLVPAASGGSVETDSLTPVGEYANSTVGRERIFEYFSHTKGIPTCELRLNYSIDMRYGVLREIGEKVLNGEPVDLTMGYVNVIWQGDVAKTALLSLDHCAVPPEVFNITGPETASVREIAIRFAKQLGRAVSFTGTEAPTALLSDTSKAFKVFGRPEISLETMIDWTAAWLQDDLGSWEKPTHFEVRDGAY